MSTNARRPSASRKRQKVHPFVGGYSATGRCPDDRLASHRASMRKRVIPRPVPRDAAIRLNPCPEYVPLVWRLDLERCRMRPPEIRSRRVMFRPGVLSPPDSFLAGACLFASAVVGSLDVCRGVDRQRHLNHRVVDRHARPAQAGTYVSGRQSGDTPAQQPEEVGRRLEREEALDRGPNLAVDEVGAPEHLDLVVLQLALRE